VTIYIIMTSTKTESPGLIQFTPEISVFESMKDLEVAAHNATRIYEYTDGKLTVLERKPVYKTVMKEVQEVDSYIIETSAVRV
jgi:hypothetical protein